MDLITAVAILVQGMNDLQATISQLSGQAFAAQSLVGEENSVTAINPQVHALTASMNIAITAIHSQLAVTQQNVDKVAELSNT